MLKIFMLVASISLAAFIISVFMHNTLSGLLELEEPDFFFIALLSVVALAVGTISSLVVFIKGLFGKTS